MQAMIKMKIVQCSDDDFWYKNMIGQIVEVQEPGWPTAYLEEKSGKSILRYDLEEPPKDRN
jgi:hypothetical protein